MLTWKSQNNAELQRLRVTRMIRRNISYKDKSLIVPLYKAIVRPHLRPLASNALQRYGNAILRNCNAIFDFQITLFERFDNVVFGVS